MSSAHDPDFRVKRLSGLRAHGAPASQAGASPSVHRHPAGPAQRPGPRATAQEARRLLRTHQRSPSFSCADTPRKKARRAQTLGVRVPGAPHDPVVLAAVDGQSPPGVVGLADRRPWHRTMARGQGLPSWEL